MRRSLRRLSSILLALGGCTGTQVVVPIVTPVETARPVVIAHRGSSYAAPEHTFAAYDLAVSEGADYIEQDVQRTSDGVLVVIHDASLDRTIRGEPSACSGAVADKSLAQLKTCDAGAWFNATYPSLARPLYAGLRIPTLAEVLDRYGSTTRYYIEIKDPEKYPGIERALIDLLNARSLTRLPGVPPRVLVQSFDALSLRRMRQLDSGIPLIQLVGNEGSAAVIAKLPGIREYAIGVGPHQGSVDAALVAAAHGQCLLVHPYTVDAPAQIQALLALPVDGIFTNRPDFMRAAVGSRVLAALPMHCTR